MEDSIHLGVNAQHLGNCLYDFFLALSLGISYSDERSATTIFEANATKYPQCVVKESIGERSDVQNPC